MLLPCCSERVWGDDVFLFLTVLRQGWDGICCCHAAVKGG